jgi:hypothetical protein
VLRNCEQLSLPGTCQFFPRPMRPKHVWLLQSSWIWLCECVCVWVCVCVGVWEREENMCAGHESWVVGVFVCVWELRVILCVTDKLPHTHTLTHSIFESYIHTLMNSQALSLYHSLAHTRTHTHSTCSIFFSSESSLIANPTQTKFCQKKKFWNLRNLSYSFILQKEGDSLKS